MTEHSLVSGHRLMDVYNLGPNPLAFFAAHAGIVLGDFGIRHFPVQQYRFVAGTAGLGSGVAFRKPQFAGVQRNLCQKTIAVSLKM